MHDHGTNNYNNLTVKNKRTLVSDQNLNWMWDCGNNEKHGICQHFHNSQNLTFSEKFNLTSNISFTSIFNKKLEYQNNLKSFQE